MRKPALKARFSPAQKRIAIARENGLTIEGGESSFSAGDSGNPFSSGFPRLLLSPAPLRSKSKRENCFASLARIALCSSRLDD